MKHTRLTDSALAAQFAYGGEAYRQVRKAQARTIGKIVKRFWRPRAV